MKGAFAGAGRVVLESGLRVDVRERPDSIYECWYHFSLPASLEGAAADRAVEELAGFFHGEAWRKERIWKARTRLLGAEGMRDLLGELFRTVVREKFGCAAAEGGTVTAAYPYAAFTSGLQVWWCVRRGVKHCVCRLARYGARKTGEDAKLFSPYVLPSFPKARRLRQQRILTSVLPAVLSAVPGGYESYVRALTALDTRWRRRLVERYLVPPPLEVFIIRGRISRTRPVAVLKCLNARLKVEEWTSTPVGCRSEGLWWVEEAVRDARLRSAWRQVLRGPSPSAAGKQGRCGDESAEACGVSIEY